MNKIYTTFVFAFLMVLFSNSGVAAQSFYEPGVYGNWKVQDSRDEFTDEYRVSAVSETDDDDFLLFGCTNVDETYFKLGLDENDLTTEEVDVRVRVDKKKPVKGIKAVRQDDGYYAFLDVISDEESIGALGQQMKNGRRVIVMLVDGEGNKSSVLNFSLKGFRKAQSQVIKKCKENR